MTFLPGIFSFYIPPAFEAIGKLFQGLVALSGMYRAAWRGTRTASLHPLTKDFLFELRHVCSSRSLFARGIDVASSGERCAASQLSRSRGAVRSRLSSSTTDRAMRHPRPVSSSARFSPFITFEKI